MDGQVSKLLDEEYLLVQEISAGGTTPLTIYRDEVMYGKYTDMSIYSNRWAFGSYVRIDQGKYKRSSATKFLQVHLQFVCKSGNVIGEWEFVRWYQVHSRAQWVSEVFLTVPNTSSGLRVINCQLFSPRVMVISKDPLGGVMNCLRRKEFQ